MNKKGQVEYIKGIIALAVILIVGSWFAVILSDMSCSNEKSQITALTQERDYWSNLSDSMNKSIANCSNLIKEQKDICDSRIENATEQSGSEKQTCINFSIFVRYLIVIHTLTLIFFIPLTINIFKIVFNLGEEVNKVVKFYKTIWFWVKVFLWFALLVIVLATITTFFS